MRNANALQTLATARNFYFDKTGTLTYGKLTVVDSVIEKQAQIMAATLARRGSTHPVADAISLISKEDLKELKNIAHLASRGMQGELSTGAIVTLSSYRSAQERDVIIPIALKECITSWIHLGHSISLLDLNGIAIGAFALDDVIRPEAKEIVSILQNQGKKIFILSGDSQNVVRGIAKELGIPDTQAIGDLYPEEKAYILENDIQTTAMIGDGLNDALAMQASSVGIGVSGGIEATLECADIFITQGTLGSFLQLYRGTQKTEKIIERNIAHSIIYNVIGGGLALSGHISPLIAAVLMPLSSLSVILSSICSRSFEE